MSDEGRSRPRDFTEKTADRERPGDAALSHEQHRATSPASVSCAVITVSDTRTSDTDTAGRAIVNLLEAHGHLVSHRDILKDEPEQVRALVARHLEDERVQVVITTGGTGITSRDGTYEAVTALFEKTLTGFGELFRMLSWEQIGSGAMLSRATGGVARGKLLFAMPGSTGAVELAMSRLILPELKHLLHELRKQV